MKNFWTSFKAFLNSPLKFVADPANTVLDYQVKLMAAEGRSMAEIDQTLTENGYLKGEGIVPKVFKGVVDLVDFTFKNLPLILFLVILLVVGWYVMMAKKAVTP
jgi:hypothetical protein